MFRTDRGDAEGDDEWNFKTHGGGFKDQPGDDDVSVTIRPQASGVGNLTVRYRTADAN
jgi:hypothetical protein